MTDRSVVVEAVFEQEAAKAEIFRQLDTVCSIDCVIATNTSTIPISVLASYVSEPRRMRFIGTHYFSPASRMKLVEVIPGGGNVGRDDPKHAGSVSRRRQDAGHDQGCAGLRNQPAAARIHD